VIGNVEAVLARTINVYVRIYDMLQCFRQDNVRVNGHTRRTLRPTLQPM